MSKIVVFGKTYSTYNKCCEDLNIDKRVVMNYRREHNYECSVEDAVNYALELKKNNDLEFERLAFSLVNQVSTGKCVEYGISPLDVLYYYSIGTYGHDMNEIADKVYEYDMDGATGCISDDAYIVNLNTKALQMLTNREFKGFIVADIVDYFIIDSMLSVDDVNEFCSGSVFKCECRECGKRYVFTRELAIDHGCLCKYNKG